MEELVESNLLFLEEWNRENGLHLTREEARAGLLEFLPTLARWKNAEEGPSSPLEEPQEQRGET